MSDSKTKHYDLQSVFILFRNALKIDQSEYVSNRDPYTRRWHFDWQSWFIYGRGPIESFSGTLEYCVLLPLKAYWKFVFYEDGRDRTYQFVVDALKRLLLDRGPCRQKRWYERAIIKPQLKLRRKSDFFGNHWFNHPTEDWKELVEELCIALKSIELRDYIQLTLMLEDEFGLDLCKRRLREIEWSQRRLFDYWLHAKLRGAEGFLDNIFERDMSTDLYCDYSAESRAVSDTLFERLNLSLRGNDEEWNTDLAKTEKKKEERKQKRAKRSCWPQVSDC